LPLVGLMIDGIGWRSRACAIDHEMGSGSVRAEAARLSTDVKDVRDRRLLLAWGRLRLHHPTPRPTALAFPDCKEAAS
jgi:hypothetical protein